MTAECLRPDELEEVIRAGATGARWRHVHECARCQALLMSYESFMEPGETPAGAELEQARARMDDVVGPAIAEWVGRRSSGQDAGDRAAAPAGGAAPSRTPRREAPPGFWSFLYRRPVISFAVASSLVVVAGAIFLFAPSAPNRAPSGVMRGPGAGSAERGGLLAIGSPVVLPDQSLRLTWRSSPTADRYVVRICDANLEELARYPAGAETSLVLRHADLAAPPFIGAELLWQVHALRGGDLVAESEFGRVLVP